jgi:hypothetical protein
MDTAPGDAWPVLVPVTGVPAPELETAAADLIVLGRIQVGALRIRAWYRDPGLSLAVHAGLPLARRSRLLAGAKIREQLRSVTSIVIPRPLDHGRGLRHAWVLEDFVTGIPIPGDEWAAAVPLAAEGLTQIWQGLPVRSDAVGRVVDRKLLGQFLDLVDSDLEPGQRVAVREAVERLAAMPGRVLVGLCHGDPVSGNWLRTPDGRLALVDWEHARPRPLGHDAVRLILGHPDAPSIADAMVGRLGEAGTHPGLAPWRDQLALALIRWLAAWRIERAAATRMDRLEDHRLRVRHRLELFRNLAVRRD